MPTIRIRNWERIYETSESRKRKRTRWVAIPTDLSSFGLKEIAKEKDGGEIFGMWILMVEIAAMSEPRGDLVRSDGVPYTAEMLETKTGFPARAFKRTIGVCERLSWLEILDPGPGSADLPQKRQRAVKPGSTVQYSTRQDITEQGQHAGKPASQSFPSELDSPEFRTTWSEWERHRVEIKKKLTPTSIGKQLKLLAGWGQPRAIAAIEHTISNGWQGIREPDVVIGPNGQQSSSWFDGADLVGQDEESQK